jgi:hypothetical protein
MSRIRWDLIKELVVKFDVREISLQSILMELSAAEFVEFINAFDKFTGLNNS